MTEIYLVRHPESELNAAHSLVGGRSNETPITKRGEEQARRFAKAFLAQYPQPDAYYSSPAVRTKALFDIYNETVQQQNKYVIDLDLQEMSQGKSEGMPRGEVYTAEVLELIAQQERDFSMPGGESLNDVSDRMFAWIHKVEQAHPDGVVLAAGHGQAIRAPISQLLNWSHYESTIDPAHQTDNVSLTHLTVKDGKTTVNFWGKNIIEPVEIAPSKLY